MRWTSDLSSRSSVFHENISCLSRISSLCFRNSIRIVGSCAPDWPPLRGGCNVPELELNFSHPLKFESPKSFNDTTKLRKLASEQSTRPNHRLMNDHSLIPQILDIVLLRLMSMIIAKDKLHFHKILTWKPRTLPMAGEVLETGYGLYIG